jgi:hypothetical protein
MDKFLNFGKSPRPGTTAGGGNPGGTGGGGTGSPPKEPSIHQAIKKLDGGYRQAFYSHLVKTNGSVASEYLEPHLTQVGNFSLKGLYNYSVCCITCKTSYDWQFAKGRGGDIYSSILIEE